MPGGGVLILALDGALGPLTAALLDTVSGSTWVESAPPRDALEQGLRATDAALRAAGKRPADLGRLAVTVGPGGFTGLRIALTYAKSLAFALGLPLIGVSSYDALTPARMTEPALVAVRGRAGAACVRLRLGGGEERLCAGVDDVAAWVRARSGDTLLAAAGMLEELTPAFERAGVRLQPCTDGEPAALRVARAAAAAVPLEGVHGVVPDYGERPRTTQPR
ncbi:tRNA (adenosine(37)-N6)-threonylcarbamoyltransferase complex dimerization subunit type 1 TsaB [bacterium]|nr:MAG: tRNA (adenosine(37)-N6)-threonylcarbamoyltransferase complex dimerization subunit type 1 TsaB [bacterium]